MEKAQLKRCVLIWITKTLIKKGMLPQVYKVQPYFVFLNDILQVHEA